MVRGLGKKQKEQLFKTECKIVAFLNLQPFGFNELQLISGISNRNSLRKRLDVLIKRKIVTIIKNPTNKNRRGTYYSLSKDKAKTMIDAYYNEGPSPFTKEVKEQVLASINKFRRKIEAEDDVIIKQIAAFKQEMEPFIDPNTPDKYLDTWLDSLSLYKEGRKLMDIQAKIWAIKLRIKLDYVNK